MAQLVEHHLAKVGVAGSNPVVRSMHSSGRFSPALLIWRRGQVVRHGPAKPLPPVRIWASPPANASGPGNLSRGRSFVPLRGVLVHWDALPLLRGTAQKRRHDRDDERPEERRAKAINEHAGVRYVAGEVACQLEHERVDDEREQAKRDNRERQAQDLEDGLHRRVDEREEQGREDGARVRPAHDLDAGDEPDGRSHRDGPDEPPSKKSHVSPFDVLVGVYPRAAGGVRGTLATGFRAIPAARLPRNPL